MKAKLVPNKESEQKQGRSYLSQQDVPGASLDKALRVATAIADNFGYKAASPLQIAGALNMSPSSGPFRMLTGASIAYGLTSGGYNADQISLTPLGSRVVRPTAEGDDLEARREALLKPRVSREFLSKYDRAPVPREDIGQNVLVDMGVPKERAADVLQLVLAGAEAVGFLHEIKGRKYVELTRDRNNSKPQENQNFDELQTEEFDRGAAKPHIVESRAESARKPDDHKARRVFITHGKNRALIEPIKKLLGFGELEAVVSVQSQTVSQPVPDKVMEEMRSCGAAIIHVEDERRLLDKEGNEHIALNDNVLIEIGAAMALYGQKRFILVVKEGVKLPSNLQGLLELRYKGETLDMDETVKLLEAINDIKKRAIPVSQ